ncbi:hypothetical protein EON82_16710 [bacterium]|nr:MAG: hypothetical protein EON82_16710 [bacterium]
MKNYALSLVILSVLAVLIGCGSEQAPGYDAASKDAAEALAKNGNDITKLTPEQKAALEKAATQTRPNGSMLSTNGGGAGSPNVSTGG